MKIEKPNWTLISSPHIGGITRASFYNWFEREVELINKILSEGVEVYAPSGHSTYFDKQRPSNATHKALLINIEPIKKETAEDVLRAYIEHDRKIEVEQGLTRDVEKIYKRAKAVLE